MKPLLVVLTACLLSPIAWAGTITGQLQTVGGFDSNPAGYTGAEAQGVGSSQLQLGWRAPYSDGDGEVRLTYLGGVSAFAPQSDWTAHNHELRGAFNRKLDGDLRVGALASISGTWNRPAYEAYTYRQYSAEGWAQTKLDDIPLYASVEGVVRKFPESPAFDYREFSATTYTTRQWDTRTTLRLTLKGTGRTYTTQTLEDFFAGQTNATSSQFQVGVLVSQGLTDRTGLRLTAWGLRGSGETRLRDDYAASMDDPLAQRGAGGRIQLSTLAPAMMTFRTYVGAQSTTAAYITMLGDYGEHTDNVGEAGVILEGPAPWVTTASPLTWNIELNAQRQTSTDAIYTFNRASVMVGLKYAF
jgi:hypothetical protein